MLARFPRRGHAGFTLLEVVVAMAILATVLVVLLENHSTSIRMSERARKLSIAANLARDLMTEVEMQGFPELGSETGDFEEKYPGQFPDFTWERNVNISIFADFIREVEVKVTYLEDGRPRSIELLNFIGARDVKEQERAEEEVPDEDAEPGAGSQALSDFAGEGDN
ncbi:prepilin-type N-terminal cleavage/methylation domain-containing protein [bacterium]|nr:prepilin-type N-terminal cleavage/methylation domain-containing protein [bacterium]